MTSSRCNFFTSKHHHHYLYILTSYVIRTPLHSLPPLYAQVLICIFMHIHLYMFIYIYIWMNIEQQLQNSNLNATNISIYIFIYVLLEHALRYTEIIHVFLIAQDNPAVRLMYH
jgi:hypothetical protein